MNSNDTIAAQVAKAQGVWKTKWKNVFLDLDGIPATTPVCDRAISGAACDTDMGTHLDYKL